MSRFFRAGPAVAACMLLGACSQLLGLDNYDEVTGGSGSGGTTTTGGKGGQGGQGGRGGTSGLAGLAGGGGSAGVAGKPSAGGMSGRNASGGTGAETSLAGQARRRVKHTVTEIDDNQDEQVKSLADLAFEAERYTWDVL